MWYDFAMQTVLDIPDTQYDRLTAKAEHEGTPVLEIVLRGIDKELDRDELPRKVNRLTQPILKSYAPGSIRLTNEQIYDSPEQPKPASEPAPEPRKRFKLPLIPSTRTDKLFLTNEMIDDLLASDLLPAGFDPCNLRGAAPPSTEPTSEINGEEGG